jgi:hypothetical protein
VKAHNTYFYGTRQWLSKRTYNIVIHSSNAFMLPSFFVYYSNYLNKSRQNYCFSSLLCILINANNTKRKKSNPRCIWLTYLSNTIVTIIRRAFFFISFLFWQDRTGQSMACYFMNLTSIHDDIIKAILSHLTISRLFRRTTINNYKRIV